MTDFKPGDKAGKQNEKIDHKPAAHDAGEHASAKASHEVRKELEASALSKTDKLKDIQAQAEKQHVQELLKAAGGIWGERNFMNAGISLAKAFSIDDQGHKQKIDKNVALALYFTGPFMYHTPGGHERAERYGKSIADASAPIANWMYSTFQPGVPESIAKAQPDADAQARYAQAKSSADTLSATLGPLLTPDGARWAGREALLFGAAPIGGAYNEFSDQIRHHLPEFGAEASGNVLTGATLSLLIKRLPIVGIPLAIGATLAMGKDLLFDPKNQALYKELGRIAVSQNQMTDAQAATAYKQIGEKVGRNEYHTLLAWLTYGKGMEAGAELAEAKLMSSISNLRPPGGFPKLRNFASGVASGARNIADHISGPKLAPAYATVHVGNGAMMPRSSSPVDYSFNMAGMSDVLKGLIKKPKEALPVVVAADRPSVGGVTWDQNAIDKANAEKEKIRAEQRAQEEALEKTAERHALIKKASAVFDKSPDRTKITKNVEGEIINPHNHHPLLKPDGTAADMSQAVKPELLKAKKFDAEQLEQLQSAKHAQKDAVPAAAEAAEKTTAVKAYSNDEVMAPKIEALTKELSNAREEFNKAGKRGERQEFSRVLLNPNTLKGGHHDPHNWYIYKSPNGSTFETFEDFVRLREPNGDTYVKPNAKWLLEETTKDGTAIFKTNLDNGQILAVTKDGFVAKVFKDPNEPASARAAGENLRSLILDTSKPLPKEVQDVYLKDGWWLEQKSTGEHVLHKDNTLPEQFQFVQKSPEQIAIDARISEMRSEQQSVRDAVRAMSKEERANPLVEKLLDHNRKLLNSHTFIGGDVDPLFYVRFKGRDGHILEIYGDEGFVRLTEPDGTIHVRPDEMKWGRPKKDKYGSSDIYTNKKTGETLEVKHEDGKDTLPEGIVVKRPSADANPSISYEKEGVWKTRVVMPDGTEKMLPKNNEPIPEDVRYKKIEPPPYDFDRLWADSQADAAVKKANRNLSSVEPAVAGKPPQTWNDIGAKFPDVKLTRTGETVVIRNSNGNLLHYKPEDRPGYFRERSKQGEVHDTEYGVRGADDLRTVIRPAEHRYGKEKEFHTFENGMTAHRGDGYVRLHDPETGINRFALDNGDHYEYDKDFKETRNPYWEKGWENPPKAPSSDSVLRTEYTGNTSFNISLKPGHGHEYEKINVDSQKHIVKLFRSAEDQNPAERSIADLKQHSPELYKVVDERVQYQQAVEKLMHRPKVIEDFLREGNAAKNAAAEAKVAEKAAAEAFELARTTDAAKLHDAGIDHWEVKPGALGNMITAYLKSDHGHGIHSQIVWRVGEKHEASLIVLKGKEKVVKPYPLQSDDLRYKQNYIKPLEDYIVKFESPKK